MIAETSRRRLLAGAAATPFLALPSDPGLSHHEARFLALIPTVLPRLREYDRIWAKTSVLYAAAWHGIIVSDGDAWDRVQERPEWAAYMAARRPADAIEEELFPELAPFMNRLMRSPRAIAFKVRIGASFDGFADCASENLDRIAEAWLCA